MWKNTDNMKMKNLKSFKELFSTLYKYFLKVSFSVDELYCYLIRFCRTFFWMTFERNVPKRWFWAFAISQFPAIIFHKAWSFKIEMFSNRFWIALLFRSIGTKFSWKILKLRRKQLFLLWLQTVSSSCS